MELIKQRILRRTHSGLHIYSHVLKRYYDGDEVLSLAGRDCAPAKNPFNAGRSTLWIKIVNGMATHTCTESSIPSGDVFDFAALHFEMNDVALLSSLNSSLNLKLESKHVFFDNNVGEAECEESFEAIHAYNQGLIDVGMKEVAEVSTMSFFTKPISNIIPSKKLTVLDVYQLIKSGEYAERTTKLRAIKDVKEARKFKAFNFDYVSFSGVFSVRNDKKLIKHSGLLVIDFDHIANLEELKNILLKDPYFETQLLFISPSGDGIKWVVDIDLEQNSHTEWFQSINNYLATTYKVNVDASGKDVSRACFLPHDSNIFINPKFLR